MIGAPHYKHFTAFHLINGNVVSNNDEYDILI